MPVLVGGHLGQGLARTVRLIVDAIHGACEGIPAVGIRN